jgi:hypothetical protein
MPGFSDGTAPKVKSSAIPHGFNEAHVTDFHKSLTKFKQCHKKITA